MPGLARPSTDVTGGMAPDLSAVVDSLGFGWAQLSQLVVGGGIWAADGAELMLIGSVTRALAGEWELDAHERGMAASSVFIGMLAGNIVSGPIGDRYGRRIPVLWSYSGIICFSCLSAGMRGIIGLICCRLLVGVSIGIGQPSWNALSTEISPSNRRALMICGGQAFFSLGEAYAVVLIWLDDPSMLDLDWRRLLVLGSLVSMFLFVLGIVCLRESPRFLAIAGDFVGATKVLESMRVDNGHPNIDLAFSPPGSARDIFHQSESHVGMSAQWLAPMRIVWSKRMLNVTLIFCQTAFVANFLFYGGVYAFPQVLPDLRMRVSPVHDLLMGSMFSLLGCAFGMSLYHYLPRRWALLVYLSGAFMGQLPFVFLADSSPSGSFLKSSLIAEFMLHLGLLMSKAFVVAGFIVTYTCISEAYPTAARTTGIAVCLACGRLGAILCPIIFEQVSGRNGSPQDFFVICGCFCIINALCVMCLPDAGKGGSLEETELLVA